MTIDPKLKARNDRIAADWSKQPRPTLEALGRRYRLSKERVRQILLDDYGLRNVYRSETFDHQELHRLIKSKPVLSWARIAFLMGEDEKFARERANKMGWSKPKASHVGMNARPKLTEAQQTKLVGLFKSGWSPRRLSHVFGISYLVTGDYLYRAGVLGARMGVGVPAKTKAKILRLRAARKSYLEISSLVGRDTRTVRRVCYLDEAERAA